MNMATRNAALNKATATKCTNHWPAETAPLAVVRVGQRKYCQACSTRMLAFVASLQAALVVKP
jgi:hypothetical protein